MGDIVQLTPGGKVARIITNRLNHGNGTYTPITSIRTWLRSGAPEVARFRIAETTRDPEPAFDPKTHKLILNPAQVGGDPVETWTIALLSVPERRKQRETTLSKSVIKAIVLLLKLIKILRQKDIIVPGDFDAQTRQDYQDLESTVDDLRP